jgi:hypothetical protein
VQASNRRRDLLGVLGDHQDAVRDGLAVGEDDRLAHAVAGDESQRVIETVLEGVPALAARELGVEVAGDPLRGDLAQRGPDLRDGPAGQVTEVDLVDAREDPHVAVEGLRGGSRGLLGARGGAMIAYDARNMMFDT